MQAVKTIRGVAMPLNRADVDTDQIIPAKYLKLVERTGFGRFLFDSWRKDESFVLNEGDHRTVLRRYLPQQLQQGRPAAGTAKAR